MCGGFQHFTFHGALKACAVGTAFASPHSHEPSQRSAKEYGAWQSEKTASERGAWCGLARWPMCIAPRLRRVSFTLGQTFLSDWSYPVRQECLTYEILNSLLTQAAEGVNVLLLAGA